MVECWIRRTLWILAALLPSGASATTYAVMSYGFSWIDSSTHTKLGPTTGGVYSSLYKFSGASDCGSSSPIIDDIISDSIPLGFTFTFGNKNFTSVRVMTNGRLQFDNATCGYGSPVTQLPYPDSGLNYSMRIYGNDLDPTLKSEQSEYSTDCTSRSSCYVSYKSIGTAPNRGFVVTWNNVPEWTATNSASGSYNLQVILNENGTFIYQYGADTPGPQATLGQIGWQISTTDYAVAATGFPANNSAFFFYIPGSAAVTPGAFNAFDSDTWVGSTNGVIKTKIAGNAFTLDVAALTSTPSVLTTFTGAVKVELVDASSAAACTSMTAIQTIASSYTFTAGDKGRHTFSNISQANAYRNVKARISYPAASPTTVACSTDAFAIRPDSFGVTVKDGDWASAGTTRTLNATSASGMPIHKAGRPLTLTVTAYNSSSVVTTNYAGSPTVSINCLLPTTGCVAGTFATGTFVGSNGVLTSTTASYSEVGVVGLTVLDSSFAAVDVGDGSSSSQLNIASSPLSVGRFVPDHFDLTLNTPAFAPACAIFSYVGQPIKYATNPQVSVAAKNASGSTTQNYTASLWRITASSMTPSYSTDPAHALTVLTASSPSVVDNGGGNGTLTFADTASHIVAVNRGDPLAPFNAEIAMSFSLSDADGVTVANVNGAPASNPVSFGAASAGNGIAFSGGYKSHRWGRLVLQNAFGSELSSLSVPLFVEYFNGSAFIRNSADNCTSLTLNSQLKLSNQTTAGGALQAGNTAMTIFPSGATRATLAHATLSNGDAGLSFSAPGTGNTGYVEVASDFSSLSWLLFDWDHDGMHDDSPGARASFGLYRGNGKQLYQREVY